MKPAKTASVTTTNRKGGKPVFIQGVTPAPEDGPTFVPFTSSSGNGKRDRRAEELKRLRQRCKELDAQAEFHRAAVSESAVIIDELKVEILRLERDLARAQLAAERQGRAVPEEVNLTNMLPQFRCHL